jgi:hypothetical protein
MPASRQRTRLRAFAIGFLIPFLIIGAIVLAVIAR